MKLNLLTLGLCAFLLSIATSCSEDEIQPTKPVSAPETQTDEAAARIKNTKVILVPINGTINQIAFTGMYEITRFSHTKKTIQGGGKLYAHGRLRQIQGENLPASITSLMKREIKMPVTRAINPSSRAEAQLVTCDVLLLNLGPLDLDILGLTVSLNQVILDINAIAGGGNLIGNLLCALVGLFDGLGALANIVAILNTIITIIGSLAGS